jgi:hypothetical protein
VNDKRTLSDLGKSLSIDCSDVVLESNEDLNYLLSEKDLIFVKQYLLQKGARDIENCEAPKNKDKNMTVLKVCKRGKSGVKNREEVYNLVESMIRDNPLKPGFKTGYKEAASYINRQGYRDSNGFKWKVKTLVDFYHHYNGSNNSKKHTVVSQTSAKSNKHKSVHTIQDLVKCIIDSNLDNNIKLKLIPIIMKG